MSEIQTLLENSLKSMEENLKLEQKQELQAIKDQQALQIFQTKAQLTRESPTSKVLTSLEVFPKVACSHCPNALWYIGQREAFLEKTENSNNEIKLENLKLYCQIFAEHITQAIILCDGITQTE